MSERPHRAAEEDEGERGKQRAQKVDRGRGRDEEQRARRQPIEQGIEREPRRVRHAQHRAHNLIFACVGGEEAGGEGERVEGEAENPKAQIQKPKARDPGLKGQGKGGRWKVEGMSPLRLVPCALRLLVRRRFHTPPTSPAQSFPTRTFWPAPARARGGRRRR